MSICLIAAIDNNRSIGYENKLIYHIPEDMKFFRKITSEESENGEKPIVIMGRKTYESIGKPLPKRNNIVITNNPHELNKAFNGIDNIKAVDMDTAKTIAKESQSPVWIIGGESIYKQFINIADELYLTMVDTEAEKADSFFPVFEKEFKPEEIILYDNYEGINFWIVKWVRIKCANK